MGEIEAIGDAAAGGLLASAAEPATGAPDGHTHERVCLNCRCALVGDYCHCCGQKAHVHRTLGAFFHDLAHGVLHFEGKVWRTLPMLAWKPGELTRRYVVGERARFVSPLALFLFSVFLMFAVVSATGNLKPGISVDGKDLAGAERKASNELVELQGKRVDAVLKKQPTAALDKKIAESKADLELIRKMRKGGVSSAMFAKDTTLESDLPWLEEAYRKSKQNPDLLFYKLKSNSYKWSWAVIPLSAPFLWLLFPFSRKFRMYDHVVFITYSLSFMTLLVIVGTLLAWAGVREVAPIMMLIPPFHMYRQLKGAYSLGRFGAAWRTVMLTVAAIVVLSAFIIAMVALGVME